METFCTIGLKNDAFSYGEKGSWTYFMYFKYPSR
jgi:hypothetical protein